MIIGRRGRSGYVVTCFFDPSITDHERPERWWSRLVAKLAHRYGCFDLEAGLLPPTDTHAVTTDGGESGPAVVDSRVRFVTLESWGFDTKVRGSPWRGRLADWEGPCAALASHRRVKLRPRAYREEEYE